MKTDFFSNMKSTLLLNVLVCLLTISTNVSARSDSNLLRNTCDRKWELIYAHDDYGNVTFGSKTELRNLAMTGNSIKANIYLPDHILQLPAQSINKRGDELCFQSLRTLDHNGTTAGSTKPWISYMVCTTGHVTELDVTPSATTYTVSLDWYVKDICSDHKPIYSNYLDGSATYQSRIEKLHDAAKTMGLVGTMRDKPYVFPLDNVMLDPETGEVNGQNVNHIGQQYVDNYITFHKTPYHWFSHWSNLGQRDNARWAITGTVPYIHNADSAAVDWYADICWRLVYTNDEGGNDLFGTVNELIDHLNKGHRVRVRWDDTNVEVSNVRVKNGVVSAQVLNQVSKVGGYGMDRYFIEPATRLKYSIVHTTGKVNAYSYLIGQAGQVIIPAVRKSMEWMVDTRPWTPVLETVGRDGTRGDGVSVVTTRGSLPELRDAAMGGASIRLKIEQDPADGLFFIAANNIRVDYLSDTVYAQAMDHISDKISRIPDEFELPPTIYHIAHIASSDGTVQNAFWYFGAEEIRKEETVPAATVTWFANE